MLEKEKRPLLTNDSELDGLVRNFVWLDWTLVAVELRWCMNKEKSFRDLNELKQRNYGI